MAPGAPVNKGHINKEHKESKRGRGKGGGGGGMSNLADVSSLEGKMRESW
jgi:hypothetical protein